MMKQTIVLRLAAIAVIAAASLSLPMMSIAQAEQAAARSWGKPMKSHAYYFAREPAQQCKIFDTISHRCLTFHGDSTWPEGLSDFHGGGVGSKDRASPALDGQQVAQALARGSASRPAPILNPTKSRQS